MKKEKIGYLALITLAIVAVVGLFLLSPIKQSIEYHNFSDADKILNIPNFWNVISNLPFLIVGVLALYKLKSIAKLKFSI